MRDDHLRMRLCVLLAVILMMTCIVPVSAEEIVFQDVAGHWAETFIQQSADRKLVQGYNGLYRPDDSMSRAELVTILWRAMGEPEPVKAASFTDLTLFRNCNP